jgi:hypothetical protein
VEIPSQNERPATRAGHGKAALKADRVASRNMNFECSTQEIAPKNTPHAAGGMLGTSSIPSLCSNGRNTEKAVPLLPGPMELRR